MKRLVFAGPEELAAEASRRFSLCCAEAIEARGRMTCVLTGGSTAKLVYPRLAAEPVDWPKVELFFGDERAVASTHEDSNYRLARETLLDRVGQTLVHRMHGEEPDLDAAVAEYERRLPDVFDLVHLGVGPDGHVASLFPGHPLLEETSRRVAPVVDSPKPPPRRLTFTLPTLRTCRAIWFFALGPEKADAVKEAILDARSTLPAARAARGGEDVLWFLDRAAARGLEGT